MTLPKIKVTPVSEEEMYRKNPDFTICEAIRETWILLEEARNRLRVITSMAKKMDIKLREYALKEGKKPDIGAFER